MHGPDILRATTVLLEHGVIAFPTETVYGIGAIDSDPEAIDRVFQLKGRPSDRALIVLLADVGQLDRWARDVSPIARRLAETFWPGPLTLVLRRQPTVLDRVTGNKDTVALRVSPHPVCQALHLHLKQHLGHTVGLTATSANRFGEPPATTAEQVLQSLGPPDAGGPDFILDRGPSASDRLSTIVDCTSDRPRLLRDGAIDAGAIELTLGITLDQSPR